MFYYFRSNLRRKILVGFTLVLLIMLSVTYWSIYNLNKMRIAYKAPLDQHYSSIVAADNMGKAIDYQVASINYILQGRKVEGISLFEKSNKDFYFWFKKAGESAFSKNERILLDGLGREYSIFTNNVTDRIISNNKEFTTEEKEKYFQEVLKSITDIKKQCYALFDLNHQYMNKTIRQGDEISKTAVIFMLILVSGGVLISFLFSTKFSDYLAKPIKDLTRSARQIAVGNFSDKVEITSIDEIGDLASEFNRMSDKLEMYDRINVNKVLYEKKKLEIIIESISEPVVMTDEKFNLLTTNNSFNRLFDIVEIENKNISDFIKDESVLKGFQPTELSETFYELKRNGTRKYFTIFSSSIILPESGVQGHVILFSDITKFQELDKLKSEFVGKVSHELKSPLTSIGLALGMLEDGVMGGGNDRQKELILSMKSDYNRLNRLVREILDLSKIESGTLKLDFAETDMKVLIDDISKRFVAHCREKGIEYTNRYEGEVFRVNIDYEYMFRAIENILSNALKFTQNGGRIDLIVKNEDDFVKLEINDTGIGISPDKIDRIFDKFVQLNDDVPGSVGLGLSITREIIELHKGEVFVKSDPGKGSSFIIKLKAV